VQKSQEKEDVIMKIENSFGSIGYGNSEIICMHLYPNQWAFSIKKGGFWKLVLY
jgi:hypothetical protein